MKRLVFALVLCLAGAASAGPLSDLVMAEGGFTAAPAGTVLRYDLTRRGAGTGAGAPASLQLTVLEEAGAKLLLLEQEEAGKTREIARFPARSANPLLLYFLENVVRDMAAATGGSPFYIRNRLREALLAADVSPQADGRVFARLTPFAADPNIGKLGAFGSLALHLTFDPAHPEVIFSLKADTATGAGGYSEEMILIAGD